MKTQAELREYILKHPGRNDSYIASNLRRQGVKSSDVAAARAAMNGSAPDAARPASIGKSITDLFEQFDDVKKVLRALKQMPKHHFMDHDELRRLLNINQQRWREVAQHAKIIPYSYELPNRKHVWMHPDAQKELSAAINLSQQ